MKMENTAAIVPNFPRVSDGQRGADSNTSSSQIIKSIEELPIDFQRNLEGFCAQIKDLKASYSQPANDQVPDHIQSLVSTSKQLLANSDVINRDTNKLTYRNYVAVAAMEHVALLEYQTSRREVAREAKQPHTHTSKLRACYNARNKLHQVYDHIQQDKKQMSVKRVLLQDVTQDAVGPLLTDIEDRVRGVINKLDELEENIQKVDEESLQVVKNVPSVDSDAIIKTRSRKGFKFEDDDDEAAPVLSGEDSDSQSVFVLQQQRVLWKKINRQSQSSKNKISLKDFEDFEEQMRSKPAQDFRIVDKELGDWQLISDVFCNLNLDHNKSTKPTMPAATGFVSLFSGVQEAIDKLDYKKVVRPPQKVTPKNTPTAATPTAPAEADVFKEKTTITPVNLGFGSLEAKGDDATRTASSGSFSFGGDQAAASFGTAVPKAPPAAVETKPRSSSLSADDQYLALITALYQKHNPSKLEEIPQLLKKYGPEEMYLKLCKKYNEAPSKIQETSNKRSPSSNPFSSSSGTSLLGGRSRSEAVEESKASSQPSVLVSSSTAPSTTTPSTSSFGFGGFGASAAPTPFSNTPVKTVITASSSIADIEKRVREIYSQHNPDKLGDIPKLMKKYEGKELEMVQKLESKYPDASANNANNATPSGFGTPAKPTGFGGAPSLTPGFGVATPSSASNTPILTPGFGSPAAANSLFKSSITPTATANTPFGGGSTSSLFNKSPAATPTPFGNPAPGTTAAPSWGNNTGMGSFGQPAVNTGFGASTTNAFNQAGNSGNSFEAKVLDIYQKFNPTKIGEIPTIMEKYRGKELELIAKLEAKYKVNSGGAPVGFGSPQQPSLFHGGGQAAATPFTGGTPATPFSGGGGSSLFGGNRPAQATTPFASPAAPAPGGWGTSSPGTSLFGHKQPASTGFGGGFR